MKSIVGKTIKDQDIVIDDDAKYYVNCTLVNCKIVYPGGDPPFVNCKIENCQVTFVGEAHKTLQFMQMVGMIKQVPPAIAQMPEAPGTLH